MEQYINKHALMAEIERRENICRKLLEIVLDQENHAYYLGKSEAYKEILDLINAIEAKEAENSTDAFIEKACEFLRNYINPTARTYLFDEDIEEFRKAMKGE